MTIFPVETKILYLNSNELENKVHPRGDSEAGESVGK